MYLLDFDIIAFVISLCTLLLIGMQRQLSTRQNRFFILIVICSIVSSGAGFTSSHLINIYDGKNDMPAFIASTVYYIYHNSMPICVFSYFLALSGYYPKNNAVRLLFCVPYFICVGLILTNPVTKAVFWFSPENGYTHGPALPYLYGAAFLYLSIVFVMILTNKANISAVSRKTINSCLCIPPAAMIIQHFAPNMQLESFSGALCFLFLFLTVQNKRMNIEPVTGFFSRDVFVTLLKERIEKENNFYFILVRSPDIPILNELFDYKSYTEAVRKITDELYAVCRKKYEVMLLSEDTYALVPKINLSAASLKSDTSAIISAVEKIWTLETVQVDITVQLGIFYYPEDFVEIDQCIDFAVKLSKFPRRIANRHVFFAEDFSRQETIRKNAVLDKIIPVIKSGIVPLSYKPVFSAEKDMPTAVTASVEFTDKTGDVIRQNEIFDAVNEAGQSQQLSAAVFKTAARWFARENIAERGIRKICLHLHEAQFINSQWADTIIEDAESCCFNVSNLCLEVSEMTLHFNSEQMFTNMEKLKALGVSFAVGPFGSGYSDLEMIIKSPAQIIKIAADLTAQIDTNKKAEQLLRGTITMIEELGLTVAADGVQNEAQFAKLSDAGCTYFSGSFIQSKLDI